MRFVVVLLAVVLVRCGAPVTSPDSGVEPDAGAALDGGAEPTDASVALDAGLDDAGQVDAGGRVDAGLPDDGGLPAEDAGVTDAGPVDAGSADAGPLDAGPVDAGVVDAGLMTDGGARVRLIAANLSSGTLQSYSPGHGQRILQALAGDVVAIQEFNYGDNSAAALTDFVDDTFTPGVFFHRGSGRIPNGVISRFPIVDAGEWNDSRATDREFTWAVVDAPGPRELFVVSLHLLSTSAANRNAQAVELLQFMATVPSDLHVVLAGDLNTDGRTEAALGTLGATVVTTGPWPVDGALPDGGNGNTSANRSRPYDWVLVSPSLHSLQVPVTLEGRAFPSGLVFDTRVFLPLPFPALIDDSAANGMQHMAVVRDFVLPR